MFDSMHKSAREAIAECLKEGYKGYGYEFHDAVFNAGLRYLDKGTAKIDLENIGIFDAIEYIKSYEKDNFGEVLTDFSDPMQVGNILWYRIGGEEIAFIFENCPKCDGWWDEEIGETECKVLLAWLKDHGRI